MENEQRCKCSKQHTATNSTTPNFDDIPVRELTTADHEAVRRFQDFLRIRTITAEGPLNGANQQAMDYLSKYCDDIGVTYQILEYTDGYPIFLATLPGSDPSLPAILLNSHYDVVPVMLEKWHWDPFAATELPNGDIVARGTQDMKCVCTQYLEAIRILNAKKWQHTRTVYLAFQPDEELGGSRGMAKWVDSPEFRKLNVGFALDEGIASETATATAFYGERTVWWVKLLASGPTGHASRFVEDTAVTKLVTVLNKFMSFRNEQQALLGEGGCAHAKATLLGDVVTLNVTALQAGVPGLGGEFAYNVIPEEAMAGVDIRIPPSVSLKDFEEMLQSWLLPGMKYEFLVKSEVNNPTSTGSDNPYWATFSKSCKEMDCDLSLQVFPAATDGRYLRNVANIPVIGFSPIQRQPVLLHDHDERLNKYVYLRGIEIYEKVINDLANQPQ